MDGISMIPRSSAVSASPTTASAAGSDAFTFSRRQTPEIELADGVKSGAEQPVRVVVTRATWDKVAPKISPKADVKPEAIYEDINVLEVDPTQDFDVNCDTQLTSKS